MCCTLTGVLWQPMVLCVCRTLCTHTASSGLSLERGQCVTMSLSRWKSASEYKGLYFLPRPRSSHGKEFFPLCDKPLKEMRGHWTREPARGQQTEPLSSSHLKVAPSRALLSPKHKENDWKLSFLHLTAEEGLGLG